MSRVGRGGAGVWRRFTAAVALAAVTGLLATGCSPITAAGVFRPAETRFTQDDIAQLLGNASPGTGFEWNPTNGSSTVEKVLGDASDWWLESSAAPDSCFDVYAASSILMNTDTGAALVQPNFTVGWFDDQELSHYSHLGVSARVFENARGSHAFLDSLRSSVDACPDGYKLLNEGETFWSAESFQLSDEPDLGASKVRAVSLEERVSGDSAGAGYRTVFLVRGNVVVAVNAELFEGEDTTYDEQNEIARAVSEVLTKY